MLRRGERGDCRPNSSWRSPELVNVCTKSLSDKLTEVIVLVQIKDNSTVLIYPYPIFSLLIVIHSGDMRVIEKTHLKAIFI